MPFVQAIMREAGEGVESAENGCRGVGAWRETDTGYPPTPPSPVFTLFVTETIHHAPPKVGGRSEHGPVGNYDWHDIARFAGACQDQHAGRPAPSLGCGGRFSKITRDPGLGAGARGPRGPGPRPPERLAAWTQN